MRTSERENGVITLIRYFIWTLGLHVCCVWCVLSPLMTQRRNTFSNEYPIDASVNEGSHYIGPKIYWPKYKNIFHNILYIYIRLTNIILVKRAVGSSVLPCTVHIYVGRAGGRLSITHYSTPGNHAQPTAREFSTPQTPPTWWLQLLLPRGCWRCCWWLWHILHQSWKATASCFTPSVDNIYWPESSTIMGEESTTSSSSAESSSSRRSRNDQPVA